MHVAALSYHYGSAVGISRHICAWFQEQGGRSMAGPVGSPRFRRDPRLVATAMVAFIKHHWNAIFGMRVVGESSASSALSGPGADVDGDGD